MRLLRVLPWLQCTLTMIVLASSAEEATEAKVLIAVLARSRAHILPTYLSFIENLNYPKHAISIYIQTDHNQDNTPLILSEWSDNARAVYEHIALNTSSHIAYTQSLGPSIWEEERYVHLMKIRQNVLDHARLRDIRYVFYVDTDNFIINPETLNILIARKKTIISPMLLVKEDIAYSNYWAGMTPLGYYKSVPQYFEILRQQKKGVHVVPMVHSTILIDLKGNDADKLRYYPMDKTYDGPIDDIIHFALNAQAAKIQMHVDNEHFYGNILRQGNYHTVAEEVTGWQEYLVEVIYSRVTRVRPSQYLLDTRPPADKLGFDQIYMISLVRRPQRRQRMIGLFDELRIDAKIFDAIDGKAMTQEMLDEIGVKQLDGYEDPYFKRALKLGEIGCFLSHYYIWEEIVAKKYQQAIIFEDDVRFKPNFRAELASVLDEIKELELEWDLIYLGRKILEHRHEVWVPHSSRLVKPRYSYWTVGYMLSYTGAKKLLAQEPMTKMIAVDEYLPLMFDTHPNRQWSVKYEPRDLLAFSVAPLLIEPQYYVGQKGYISDTETSTTIDPNSLNTNKDKLKKMEL